MTFNKILSIIFSIALFNALTAPAAFAEDKSVENKSANNQRVLMKTSMGDVELMLFADKAPATVKNFLSYVEDGSYDGTIFHRVIKGFMNQGGGYSKDQQKRKTRAPVKNEADSGLSNKRGTIAMARTGQPHSATNQFFINTVDNNFLDYQNKSMRGWGYAVFGEVTKGMEVMDQISEVKTRPGNLGQNMPIEPVVIHSITKLD